MDQIEKELINVNLSDIEVNFAPKHPNYEECLKATNKLLKDFGLQVELNLDLANLNCYTFPHLKNLDVVNTFLIFNLWAFILDDHLDHHPQDNSKWLKILESGECIGEGFLEKLFQLFLTEAKRHIPKLHELFHLASYWLDNSNKFFQMCLNQTEISDEMFIDLRRKDVAALQCFYFIQVDSGLEVNKDLASDCNWNKFINNIIDNLMIINDLYSFKKEVNSGVGKGNYLYWKMKNNNISAQEAVQKLIFEAKTAEREAHYHGQKLKESYKIKGLHVYIDGLMAAMNGNHYWSKICKRYNNIKVI